MRAKADRGLLAETWAEKAREFEREMDVIRSSIRRMDRLVANVDTGRPAAAESRSKPFWLIFD
jgi:hypothetical protein